MQQFLFVLHHINDVGKANTTGVGIIVGTLACLPGKLELANWVNTHKINRVALYPLCFLTLVIFLPDRLWDCRSRKQLFNYNWNQSSLLQYRSKQICNNDSCTYLYINIFIQIYKNNSLVKFSTTVTNHKTLLDIMFKIL